MAWFDLGEMKDATRRAGGFFSGNLGENEQGFLSGALSGAAAGGAAGGPWGAAAGGVLGGAIGYSQADSARRARKKAVNDAESARTNSIRRQLGAQAQADSVIMAGMKGGQNKNSAIGPEQPGYIGSNLSSSGTF